MQDTELFHPGELAVQTRAGVREAARKTGGVIRDRMVPGMHAFIERQIMLLCASLDREGNVWASLVQGEPGFVRVVDERTLDIARDPSRLDAEDPLWRNVSADNRIGLLFIEFESRKRLRINGTVSRTQPDRLTVTVQTCYPNCPKYIQQRQATGTWLENGRQATREGHELSGKLAHTISTTDTLFVASAHPDAGADVSHRGGHPGFVQVIDDTTLRVPDYAGNRHLAHHGTQEVLRATGDGVGFELAPSGAALSVSALLASLAHEGALLLASPQVEQLRHCGNPDCVLIFVDTSRSHRRRWCCMDTCGNRAKVAKHYRSRLSR